MSITSGNVNIHGTISYVPQEPWVYSGTVRDNVLFGKEFDEKRYEEIIKMCALVEVCFNREFSGNGGFLNMLSRRNSGCFS